MRRNKKFTASPCGAGPHQAPLLPLAEHRCAEAGFTLTELLIVVAIMMLITITALPAVLQSLKDRKFSDAARVVQAALAGARDRAIASGEPRGVRLLRDEADPWECSRLMYVGVSEPYTVGFVHFEDTFYSDPITDHRRIVASTSAGDPNPHWEVVDPGRDNAKGTADDIPRVAIGQSYIRFENSGQLYLITGIDTASNPAILVLATAPNLPAPTTATALPRYRYQIIGPPVPLAQDTAPNLPEGIVIDLRLAVISAANPLASNPQIDVPRSRYLPNQVPKANDPRFTGPDGVFGTADDPSPQAWAPIEILFGPDGAVTGVGAQSPLMHFWIGEHTDKTAVRPHKLITLNTRTGTVQVFDNPASSGTAPYFPEIYGLPEQAIGRSQMKPLGCTY